MSKPTRFILLALCGTACAALLGLLFANPLDGQPKSDFLHFLGRFHPVILHTPIAFLLLLAILEFATMNRRFSSLSASIPLVLSLCILSVLTAVFTGFFLAYASGANEPLVQEHMRTSLFLAVVVLAMGALKLFWESQTAVASYRVLLLVSLGLLASASHDGGTLTHGRGYLTKYMPNAIRPVFGLAVEPTSNATSPQELVVYTDLIQPIIEQNCVSCHNPDKLKGDLNLETYDGHLKGGDLGPAVVQGDPENSELIFRVTLPEDDDEFMPPDGKTPLTPTEVATLVWWIESGASPTDTVADHNEASDQVVAYTQSIFESMRSPEEIEALLEEKQALYSSLAALNEELGILITPKAPESGEFVLDTFSIQKQFDLATLERIAPYAHSIVEADLSGTAITDEAIPVLAQFRNLESLNLSKTNITGSNLSALESITSLETLNLYGTSISNDQVSQLAELDQLKRLFVFQTELYSASAVAELRKSLPNCSIEFLDTDSFQ